MEHGNDGPEQKSAAGAQEGSNPTAKGLNQDHVMTTGARRSEKMPYFSAIPRESLRLLALRATGAPRGETKVDPESGVKLEGGSDKYGYGNWKQGLEFEDTFNHTVAHLWMAKEWIEAGDGNKALEELSGAAWGIMLPLMTFARSYASQFLLRGHLSQAEWVKTGRSADPAVLDQQLSVKLSGKVLIKPLSPVGIRPNTDQALNMQRGAPGLQDRQILQNMRHEDAQGVSFKCPKCTLTVVGASLFLNHLDKVHAIRLSPTGK